MAEQPKDLGTLAKELRLMAQQAQTAADMFAPGKPSADAEILERAAAALRARIPDQPASDAGLRDILNEVYRLAYLAGHHDTVEAQWGCGDHLDAVSELIEEHPEWSAALAAHPQPEQPRDDAGLREAVKFAEFQLGQALSTVCNGHGDPVPNLQDVRARLRAALAAHPAPSEPEGEADDFAPITRDELRALWQREFEYAEDMRGRTVGERRDLWHERAVEKLELLGRLDLAKPQPEAPAAPSGQEGA